ncbi:MAG: 50S ribosomal protein L22 [Patescibacteria group bacterium]|mgnify:CR=1 FL=1
MKATLKNLRYSPQKTRLVTNLVKGKSVSEALVILSHLPKKASLPVKKLIESAVANAKNLSGVSKDSLTVKDIRVEKGLVLRRTMPRARGSAFIIRRRNAHIFVELGSAPIKTIKTASDKKEEGQKKKLRASSSILQA